MSLVVNGRRCCWTVTVFGGSTIFTKCDAAVVSLVVVNSIAKQTKYPLKSIYDALKFSTDVLLYLRLPSYRGYHQLSVQNSPRYLVPGVDLVIQKFVSIRKNEQQPEGLINLRSVCPLNGH